MTLDEIEDRVKHSLEALNGTEELYDWRLTHYNDGAWANLQEACYFLSEGKIAEVTLKENIKAFRDRCHISYLDFRIKVAEPGKEEFRRMGQLFGVKPDVRLLPPRDTGDRRAYTQRKTLEAMQLTFDYKQMVTEKLRQQFTYLMLRTHVKPPELLALAVKLESYNPYQKRLDPAPQVTLRKHLVQQKNDPLNPAPAPAPATPMFAPSGVDNSSFEARLAPTKAPAAKRVKEPWAQTYTPSPEPMLVEVTYTPPSEIHEGFAEYCQNLYEKAKGN